MTGGTGQKLQPEEPDRRQPVPLGVHIREAVERCSVDGCEAGHRFSAGHSDEHHHWDIRSSADGAATEEALRTSPVSWPAPATSQLGLAGVIPGWCACVAGGHPACKEWDTAGREVIGAVERVERPITGGATDHPAARVCRSWKTRSHHSLSRSRGCKCNCSASRSTERRVRFRSPRSMPPM